MAEVDDSTAKATTTATMIDETYEFAAPRFFDFISGETEEDRRRAELWFESTLSYGPSPFMPRIRTGRSIKVEALCDFDDAENEQKGSESSEPTAAACSSDAKGQCNAEIKLVEAKEQKGAKEVSVDGETAKSDRVTRGSKSSSIGRNVEAVVTDNKENTGHAIQAKEEAQTPKPMMAAPTRKGDAVLTGSKKHLSAKKVASSVRNPSALKPRIPLHSSQAKTPKPASAMRDANLKNTASTPNLAQENQAVKRQKLDEGKSRQILNVKPPVLPHKTKTGLVSGTSSISSSTMNNKATKKEERKVYVREPSTHFVSAAEMVRKFQSSTRDLSLPRASSSLAQGKPRLTLTRPKEPEFETSQRIRSIRVKSTAELEEEMMAKIPKFKARPLNKKILEAPTMSAAQRSAPKPPEFQEFHLKTMERANQNAESASVASTETSRQQNNPWKPHLTEPHTPRLQTSLRARAPTVKSSIELEQEELEKAPKFKARPLNKKILESKGNMGVFCNAKKYSTKPEEFHFATDERFPQPSSVFDLFDKLSLNSESRHDNPLPRNTTPNPFHLHTEERGAEKEKKFVTELMRKKWEEERARVPKANPYPYTTDYPVIPPKPEPKHCTKPTPFQLESLVRHEEELQREMEERRRKEKEEAEMRIFRAQPVLKEDPIPVPEKVRKPLTDVQEFNLHVDSRAADRAEFDHKVKEKEMVYKRYREETESARMMEEEKALKQMRRTLVPQARPVPNFSHPFCPQKSSKEPTKARSPNLRIIKRRKQKTAMTSAVTPPMSSAAALMR